ncbi:MAG: hypothetical protein ABIX37_01245 [Gammaproteobacteria bacterium]
MNAVFRPVLSTVAGALWVLLMAAAPEAGATLRTIEQAYELTRSQVQLPGAPDGALTVTTCPTCRPVTLRVTAGTAWYGRPGAQQPSDQATVLAAFRAAASKPGTLVYVYYEPQTRRVKRIVLDVSAAPVVRP